MVQMHGYILFFSLEMPNINLFMGEGGGVGNACSRHIVGEMLWISFYAYR